MRPPDYITTQALPDGGWRAVWMTWQDDEYVVADVQPHDKPLRTEDGANYCARIWARDKRLEYRPREATNAVSAD